MNYIVTILEPESVHIRSNHLDYRELGCIGDNGTEMGKKKTGGWPNVTMHHILPEAVIARRIAVSS
jgi:hypothetical protein